MTETVEPTAVPPARRGRRRRRPEDPDLTNPIAVEVARLNPVLNDIVCCYHGSTRCQTARLLAVEDCSRAHI
jgi:hypothetical protein